MEQRTIRDLSALQVCFENAELVNVVESWEVHVEKMDDMPHDIVVKYANRTVRISVRSAW